MSLDDEIRAEGDRNRRKLAERNGVMDLTGLTDRQIREIFDFGYMHRSHPFSGIKVTDAKVVEDLCEYETEERERPPTMPRPSRRLIRSCGGAGRSR